MIAVEEVLWTVVALVGLGFASWNLVVARKDWRIAKREAPNEATKVWARFSLHLHSTLTVIEAAFILAGVIAMLRPDNPDATAQGRVLLLVVFIGASVLITSISVMWRRVDRIISQLVQRDQES